MTQPPAPVKSPGVPRATIFCPACGLEPYQRLAKSGREVLFLGRAQRFEPLSGEFHWTCRCGAEYVMAQYVGEQPVAQMAGYRQVITAHPRGGKDDAKH